MLRFLPLVVCLFTFGCSKPFPIVAATPGSYRMVKDHGEVGGEGCHVLFISSTSEAHGATQIVCPPDARDGSVETCGTVPRSHPEHWQQLRA